MTGPVIDTTATEAPDEPVDDGGFDYVPDQDRSTPADNFAGNVTPDDIEPRDGEAAPAPTTDLAVPDQPPVTGELDTVPAGHELRALAQMATTFAGADLVPKPLRGKPADCLLVLMTARDLGLSVTTAFRELHPIDGRVTASPKVKLAIIRQRRLGRVWPDPANGTQGATWYATRADDPETVYSSTFTMDDARAAALHGKDNWRHYPARMLSWRALGYLIDDAFSEVGTGLYSADELGAVTDVDGRVVIDVTEVGPVDGMPAPEPTPEQRREQRQAQADAEWITPDDAWHLQARINALPDEHRDTLRDRWKAQQRLGTRPPWAIPASAVALAKSLVAGVEGAAAKDGHDRNVRPAELLNSLGETVIMVLCGRVYPDDGLPPNPEFDVDGPGDDSPPPTDGPADGPVSAPEGSGGPEGAEPAAEPAQAHTGADAANGRPGLEALEDMAERRGRVTATVTNEVMALSLAEVDDELRTMGLPTEGAGGARRQRLIVAEVESRIAGTGGRYANLTPPPQEDQPDE